ncbi:helix-turn-helix domain-containing protein, partial [Microcystis aeruginosa CS-563/04]|nr:helix-turn-helix domain-containing protein [Microcystis aeruginosa CS-563/04]
MLKAFKYRIYPTSEQSVLLAKSFGCARWFYNYALRDLRFDNVPFGRTQFAPTLWTKSVTVG